MDAELKQCFERLEGKVDNLADRFDKMERAHDIDHDKIIRIETRIEGNIKDFDKHIVNEKTEGQKSDERIQVAEKKIESIDKKIWIAGGIIATIAGSVGGGVSEFIKGVLRVF